MSGGLCSEMVTAQKNCIPNPAGRVGTLSSGFSPTYNVTAPGVLTVVFFGTIPITGSGTLFNFKFTSLSVNNTTSPLTWQNFQYNEGNPAAGMVNGSVHVLNPTAA